MSYSRDQNNTTLWNSPFQSVVLSIPRRGIVCTKLWYCLYQIVIQTEYHKKRRKNTDCSRKALCILSSLYFIL